MNEFLLQSVFAVAGKVVLMGQLTKGGVSTKMTITIGGEKGKVLDIESLGKHPALVKAEDKEAAMLGITVSGISTEKAQSCLGSKIEF